MASPRLARLELWTAPQCASGTRLAFLPEAYEILERQALSGDSQLTLRLPLSSGATAQLSNRRVLRVVYADDSFTEWRLVKLTTSLDTSGALALQLECGDLALSLGDCTVFRTEAGGTHTHQFEALGLTPAEHLSKFIVPQLTAEGYTWIAAGTVDSTAPIDLVYDYSTPLALMKYLEQAVGAEFQLRRNGTTNYLLDLRTQVGSSAPVRLVRAGRDLLSLLREADATPMATRVVPKGADSGGVKASMAEAQWTVATVIGSEVYLYDLLGADGPVIADSQLNGYYLEKVGGTRTLITATSYAHQSVTVSDATSITTGDRLKIRRTAGGEVLDFLEHPTYKAAYGLATKVLERADLPDTLNLVGNPAMRAYTTGADAVPDGWAIIPGCGLAAAAVDKTTTAGLWRSGGSSAKVAATADGHGIETGWAALAPTALRPYFSGFASYWNDTSGGAVRQDIVLGKAAVSISAMTRATVGSITTVTVTTSGAHGLAAGDLAEIVLITPDGYNGIRVVQTAPDTTHFTFALTSDPGAITVGSATARKVWLFPGPGKPSVESAAKTWVDLGFSGIDANALGATVGKVRLMQHGSTSTTFYYDAAQLTQTDTQRDFLEGSGATRLWQAANDYLQLWAPPALRFEVDVLDLARLDGVTWGQAADDLTLGQTLTIVAPEIPGSPFAVRLLELKRRLDIEGDAAVLLSTRPEDIVDQLMRPRVNSRRGRNASNTEVPVPEAYFTSLPSSPTQTQARLTGPAGGAVYYWLGDDGQAPPVVGNIIAGGATATQWGTYGNPFTIQRNQSIDLRLHAYAALGTRLSPVRSWKIDKSAAASVSLVLSQPATGSMKAAWTPSTQVMRVRIYARRTASGGGTNWPTTSGAQGAEVSETYFVEELHVTTAGGGFDKNGSTVAGGTDYTDSTAYPWANGDHWAVIAVPIDFNWNVGTRAEASGQYVTTPPAVISSLTCTRDDDGTNCSTDGAQFTITWAEGATAFSDATHDLKLYSQYTVGGIGSGWSLIRTETSPHTNHSFVWQSENKKTAGKFDPDVTYQFKAELYDTVPTLLDTDLSNQVTYQSSCQLN